MSAESAVRRYAVDHPVEFGTYMGTIAREAVRVRAGSVVDDYDARVGVALVDVPAGYPAAEHGITRFELDFVTLLANAVVEYV